MGELVLILVLVEDGLGAMSKSILSEKIYVLILVLVEDGLGVILTKPSHWEYSLS